MNFSTENNGYDSCRGGSRTALFHPLPVVLLLVVLAAASACSSLTSGVGNPDPWRKITFDVNRLDEDGLIGTEDARRALNYEFCIPAKPENLSEVERIDQTAVCSLHPPGRIGCRTGEYLCIGSSYQRNIKGILKRLADLPYIKRIDECFFE